MNPPVRPAAVPRRCGPWRRQWPAGSCRRFRQGPARAAAVERLARLEPARRFLEHAAALERLHVVQARLRVVGGRHPVGGALDRRADDRAADRWLHARDALWTAVGVDAGRPVQVADEGLASRGCPFRDPARRRSRCDWPAGAACAVAANGRVDRNHGLHGVPVVEVVRRELEVPAQPPGPSGRARRPNWTTGCRPCARRRCSRGTDCPSSRTAGRDRHRRNR